MSNIQVLQNLDFSGGARIVNLPDATGSGHPVTWDQFNAAIEGISWKDAVRVSTQGNINLAAPGATIDGITMALNDRVLVRAQATASENGIYIWNGAATPMTRSTDANTAAELEQATVPVEEGSDANRPWRQTAVNFTLGTDPVNFIAFSSDTPPATEASAGKIRIGTQGEINTGADDNVAVTALKLANSKWAKLKWDTPFGDGSANQFDLTHNFGTLSVKVEVYRSTAPYDTVLCGVERVNVNTVRLSFSQPPAVNQYIASVTA